MRFLMRLGVLALAGVGAKSLYDRFNDSSAPATQWGTSPINLGSSSHSRATATDTPTGTDPAAKYAQPGYEDKSIGQAGNQDQELVERLLDETHGDTSAAESRFASESAGAPALAKQEHERG
jgi:hypothetical protein